MEFPNYLDKRNLELRIKYLKFVLQGKVITNDPWRILNEELYSREAELKFNSEEVMKIMNFYEVNLFNE